MKRMILALMLIFALALPVSAAEALADGNYTVEVTLSGGTGKAHIASPVSLTVAEGKAVATLCWSSSGYDRMTVDGENYFAVNSEGNSVFEIPVTLDTEMEVLAQTTTMSQPHDIAYTLYFDSATLKSVRSGGTPIVPIAVAALVALTAGAGLAAARKRRAKA